jgi:hypothetical protein
MDRTHPGLNRFAAVLVVVLAACGSSGATATPTPTSSAAAAVSSAPTSAPPILAAMTQAPVLASTPEPTPTATPTPTPKPTAVPPSKPTLAPTPAPKAAAGWTLPHQVGTASHCVSVTAGIDAASRYHVAADCDGAIHYYFSTDSGRSWTARVFALPAHREEIDPRIGVQGDVVYVAYTRIIPDGGCGGGRGLDVGVYFRTRVLPNGAWSGATKIGSVADELQSFQVAGGTLHATVRGKDGLSYYETLTGSTYHRYPISHVAIGMTSMHVGSDGRAQIAYAAFGGGIRYAVFTGSGFSTHRIAGTTDTDSDAVATLDGSNKGHVAWTRYQPAACGNIPVATYYATNLSGTWKTQRITKEVGSTSIQVDAATGRVHVLMAVEGALRDFTLAANGRWTRTTIVSSGSPWSPELQIDPATGTALVVYVDGSHHSRIYVLSTVKACGC